MKFISSILLMYIALIPCFDIAAQEKSVLTQDSGETAEPVEVQTDSLTIEDQPADSLLFTRPAYNYDMLGKRDPFESLVPEAESGEGKQIKDLFLYENAEILGIVNLENDSYALVEDNNGSTYVLREGNRVFGGYVTKIADDAVYLHIVKYGRAMTIILRLESSRYAVVERENGLTSVKKPGINIIYRNGYVDPKEIIIEDVTVPFSGIKMIEEEWFGIGGGIQNHLHKDSSSPQTEESALCILIEPHDNSWIRVPYNFNWTDTPGDNIRYSLIIDDDPDFMSPEFIKENVPESSYLITDDIGLPPNTRLFWKVMVIEPSGERLNSKQTDMSFKIIGQQ